MLAELSWPQVLDWLAFYELDPWGQRREDLRAGMLAALLLAPWSETIEPPNLTWPYFDDDGPGIDPEAGFRMLEDHKRRFGYT
jgi:hypothetical protein